MVAAPPIRLFKAAWSTAAEAAAVDVLRSGQIASGPRVDEFQRAVAALLGQPQLVCTNDMTSALVLALHLAGVGRGDEVLTLAYSCMSSNSAISRVGATPVWVDLHAETASMSVDDLTRALTPRCKAVTMYHVAGYPGPAAEVAQFCREHGLRFIEDCNNASGATSTGQPVGRQGHFAVYSFYPNRNINAIEGGALACQDGAAAARALRLRRFGIDGNTFRDSMNEINPHSEIAEVGWSASFNQLNAAVGLTQLPRFAEQLSRTRLLATRMQAALAGLRGIQVVAPLAGADPAYWVLLILAEQRDRLLQALKSQAIDCSKLHQRNDVYTGFGAASRPLPGTDRFMSRVLGVPCGWWLSDEEAARVVACIRQAALN
jgi:perosamine synthetase